MASLQSSYLVRSSYLAPSREIKATIDRPKLQATNLAVPKLLVSQQNKLPTCETTRTLMEMKHKIKSKARNDEDISNSKVLQELYAIMNIVSDRAEMHKNIGAQRDNWNQLLLSSVNAMVTTAATLAGLSAITENGAPFLALKFSSSLLYMAATGILLVMNKIQPSQLAVEQRNASRLFKQLHGEIKTKIALRHPTFDDVQDAMEKVLALDKAYPLPLLGRMLDKFPSTVEPAVWWPQEVKSQEEKVSDKEERNGWNEKLEEELKEVAVVTKREDTAEYVRLTKLVLKVNKILAICGPLFTGIATVGCILIGSSLHGWAALLGVMFGALAAIVNTLEHGGQIGMVFEMYRSSAGFFRLMGETIDSNLNEREVDRRENGELFEVKVALQLGRSLSELRDLASESQSSSTQSPAEEESASKLF